MFPLRTANQFVERVAGAPPDVPVRRWVLRDDNQQQYHGRLRLQNEPLYLELRWKPDARGGEQVVGTFRLHLRPLVEAGYARTEGEATDAEEIRLRFYRGERGVIYIQTRDDGPRLPVGIVDTTLG